jgi:putative endonuclease
MKDQYKQYYVYILSSLSGILYVGFTSNLIKRMYEHKSRVVEGFTKKYNCNMLVYYEVGDSFEGVLAREKQIKNWRREKKINLIEKNNKGWKDLTKTL